MAIREGESIWKLLIASAVLVFFFCAGVVHLFYPDRYKRFTLRKGGELLTQLNRAETRIFGLVMAVSAGYMLYLLATDVLVR